MVISTNGLRVLRATIGRIVYGVCMLLAHPRILCDSLSTFRLHHNPHCDELDTEERYLVLTAARMDMDGLTCIVHGWKAARHGTQTL